ncbi:MAG TPA: hypothetical protein VGJ70_02785 [Solirubrobacteraceae bacterium]
MPRLLLALLLAGALAAPTAAHASAALETGIADDRLLFGDPDAAAAAVGEWSAAGVDIVRIHARWSSIAPDRDAVVPPREFHPANPGDPRYDWAALDRAVRLVRGAGLRVMLAITGPGPVWSSADPSRHDGRFKPSPAHFRAFATAVATRYGADVDRYLIWNEPNQPLWLTPQRFEGRPYSPHLYRELVNAAVPAVHAADPGSEVVIGALAPSGSDGHTANAPVRPLAFLRGLACVDSRYRALRSGRCAGFLAPAADGFSLHPHGIRLAPDAHARSRDDAPLGDLARFEAVLDRLTDARRLRVTAPTRHFRLYLTEFAYQTNPPDRYLGVAPSTQAAWLVRGMQRAWSDPRVVNLSWYVWRDEPLGRNGSGWQSGLFYADGRPKPAFAAFQLPFAATTTRVWGQVRPGTTHTVAVEARSPRGAYREIASLETDARGSFAAGVRAPSWARYVRARVVDNTAGAGPISLPVRVRA